MTIAGPALSGGVMEEPCAPVRRDRRGGAAWLAPPGSRCRRLGLELAKIGAFGRRDLLVTLSYRFAFVSDVLGLLAPALIFSFVSRIVDPGQLPSFGDGPSSYLEFVVIGIALGGFLQVGLGRMAAAIHGEQLMGTLEVLFASPIRPVVMQAGLMVYDLLYVPVRTALFLVMATGFLGVDLHLGQAGPALALMMVFIPLVWGIGAMAAAAVLTFRRGMNPLGLVGIAVNVGSGAFFPVDLLPGWLQALARFNPIAISLQAMRETLLGGAGWSNVAHHLVLLIPMTALSLAAGKAAFSLALRRERRLGTLGHY